MNPIAPPLERNSMGSGDVPRFRGVVPESGAFLRTLDLLTERLAFFDFAANLLHVNTSLQDLLGRDDGGERLGLELGSFSEELCAAARMRPLDDRVERVAEREIADTLTIRPHTARNHTSHVLAKLGVRARAETGPRLGIWKFDAGQ
jgi:hypothetical protein